MRTVQITLLLFLSTCMLSAQPINQQTGTDEKSSHLIGKINKEGLSGENYGKWFIKNYNEYQPSKEAVANLSSSLNDYTIQLFMGTWCGDSKKEVPRFYKVLGESGFPLERLTSIAVSRDRASYKQSPGGEEEGLYIHRVPTFIIYKDGKEVNRIVEHPVISIEDDLIAIIKGDYRPNYHAVTMVNELLETTNSRKFARKSKKLLPKLKEQAKNSGELNTYSSVLFFADRKDEALAVARLNAKLFPEESRAYQNLGNKLSQLKHKEEALENYEKALQLDPENERLKKSITSLKGASSK